ncbi:hypothetical protein FIBSPDRAFT_917742 [Athelia psychrophila]|uniref:MYND-type domain-containing protein n=1 Tax=Athelia psychrophila TaxID=1759441 RepID=A0A166RAZ8_9AGAM|nr:hypothetical protein FIBSPDRAFT_917742 [Fibularhizoctonia sp. CBS 109695]
MEGSEPNALRESYFQAEFKSLFETLSFTDGRAFLEKLPCAHSDAAENWRCPNDGTMACANCKLVSYCSKGCQTTHWKTHKADCKDPVRGSGWTPSWIKEKRSATFMQPEPSQAENWLSSVDQKTFALGLHLWGGVPAVDSINWKSNEGKSLDEKIGDYSLAYVASGDIRNVIRTVNELPPDYSGHISILLNDREPAVVARNLLLLTILGMVDGDSLAADVALHFWYSVFVPMGYDTCINYAMMRISEHSDSKAALLSMPLGPNACVKTCTFSAHTKAALSQMMGMDVNLRLGIEAASKEYSRVRFEPSRKDRHDRRYTRLEPSHRFGALEYRRFGIVLPFGAGNNRFSTPNKFLFSPGGRWLQSDLADPLDGWDLEAVVAAGKACGAQREDLYGCLYFYLSGQLRSFAKRLKQFHITFHIFDRDARDLSKDIQSGALAKCGVQKSARFDRVDVSNIFDTEYVGISNVLADWAPLLNQRNPHATIIGYSMNWAAKQPGARQPSDKKVMGKCVAELAKRGKLDAKMDPTTITGNTKYMTAIYDNSIPWQRYLQTQRVEEASNQAGVKLKDRHTIVPHRIGAPLGALSNALPVYLDEESWYLGVQVSTSLLTERYLEFSRI